jgi:hypothetical protein
MKARRSGMLCKLLLVLLIGLPVHAGAQAVSNVLGTLESGLLEGGFIVIDGARLVVRADELVITYEGKAVRNSVLQEGLRVFYSTRADGSVSELTLVGPAEILEQLDNN